MAFGDPKARFEITAEDRSATAFNQVNARLKSMEQGFGSLATVARGTLGLLSAGAVLSFGKAMFEAADAVGDMSARLGVSASELSKLKYVAGQSDVEFQSLSVGIKAFQKNLDDTNPALQSLGLSAEKLKSLSLSQQFEALAGAFKTVENPADRTRIAMELFGKAGVDLVPLLAQGSEGMRRLGDEAQRVGAVMDGATAAAIGRADEAIKRMEASVKGAATALIGKLAPAIVAVSDSIREALTTAGVDPLQQRLESINDGIAKTSQLIDELTLRRSRAGTVRLSDESVAGEKVGASRAGGGFDIGQLRTTLASLTASRDDILAKINTASVTTIADAQTVAATSGLQSAKASQELQELAAIRANVNKLFAQALSAPMLDGAALTAQLEAEQALHNIKVDGFALNTKLAAEEIDLNRSSLQERLADIQSFSNAQMASAKSVVDYSMQQYARDAQAKQSALTAVGGALQYFAGKSKALAVASFLVNQRTAIAEALANTHVGATKGLAQGGIWGFVQLGAILAAGYAQVAQIRSIKADGSGGAGGGGPIPLGTSVNPAFTNSSGIPQEQGAKGQRAVQVVFNGPVWGTNETRQMILDTISEAVNDRDVVIISGNSRQAQELIPT